MLHSKSEQGQGLLEIIVILAILFGAVALFCKYVLPVIAKAIWGDCPNIAC